MYNRKEWIRYRIKWENLKSGGKAIVISVKTEKHRRQWNWLGIFTEWEVKQRLSDKQFTSWKAGKQTEFMRYTKK